MARETVSPGEFLEELEGYRQEHRKVYPYRGGSIPTKEQWAASKRKAHQGGDINHRFEGERYLNTTEKWVRRKQLRKLIDEGGETTVGGEKVAHPLLSRWESFGVGLTLEEIDKLETMDAPPDALVTRGWWTALNRENHFSVAIGSGCVMEGETGMHSKELLAAIPKLRKAFVEWGAEDPDKAILNRYEHAGIDVEHGDFNFEIVRRFCNTPELQDAMRQAFILRLHQQVV